MDPAGFLADILAEPDALAGLLDAYAQPGGPLSALGSEPLAGRRVVLLGMGSSRYAALNAALELRARGLSAAAEYGSAERGTAPGADVVAVAISASGGSAETLAALEPHLGVSRTVALTNDPDSELAARADVLLPLLAGPEHGGVACRSFQATLAVLLLLAGVSPGQLLPAVAAQQRLFERRGQWLEELLAFVAVGSVEVGGEGATDAVRAAVPTTIYTVAPAARIASAQQSALMLREGPRIPAVGCETGDWSHVDVYLTKYSPYTALVFGGSRYEPELRDWMAQRGGRFACLGRPVPGADLQVPFDGAEDHWLAQLVETSIVELLAAEWWARRAAAAEMP